jgi:probable rRNA maturation factor
VQLTGSPLGTYEVSLRLTTDAEIAELNQSFRQIDQPTDVLAFAALEQDFPLTPDLLNTEPLYLGDIVISLDTAQGQAAQAGHSLVWELAWLAAHGFLHLLGWDHPDEASLAAMMQKQYELLAALDL